MDNYDTPDAIALKIAKLVPKGGLVCEPAAGLGAIAKFLPIGATCIELDRQRYCQGRKIAPSTVWHNLDFLDLSIKTELFDTIVTNPPFSQLSAFIEVGLLRLAIGGQLIYLMPLEWLGSKQRSAHWLSLDAHIERTLVIPGRVDYLVEGIPMSQLTREDGKRYSGRRNTDAVFIIRHGKQPTPTLGYL